MSGEVGGNEDAVNIDVPFTDEDRRRLREALGSHWPVDEAARLLALAGASEILSMATGRHVPATLTEVRTFRIFNLLQQGMSWSKAEVLIAAIFKVPTTTAKRMLAATVARYGIELQTGLSGTLREVLEAATWDERREQWAVRLPTTFIRERILQTAEELPRPDPTRAAGSLWRFEDETYQAVRTEFGLPPRPRK